MAESDSKPTGGDRQNRGAGRQQSADPGAGLEGTVHSDILPENIRDGIAVFAFGQPAQARHQPAGRRPGGRDMGRQGADQSQATQGCSEN